MLGTEVMSIPYRTPPGISRLLRDIGRVLIYRLREDQPRVSPASVLSEMTKSPRVFPISRPFYHLASESQLRVWIKPIWPLFFRWVCLQAKGSKIGLVSLIFIFILRLSCLIIIVALIDRCGKLIRQVFDREGFLRNRCYWGLVSKIYGCIPSNYPSSLTSCIWPSVDSSHNPNLSKASPRK